MVTSMRNFRKHFPLILLASAIAFSPGFGVGELADGSKIIEIRVEDILLIILGIFWIAHILISGRKNIEKPPLLIPILAWLGFGLLSSLTNLIIGNLDVSRTFFFFVKEIEFFVFYFYVFYHIRNIDAAKLLVKIWLVLGALNGGWILFELITGIQFTFYYGPTLFAEPENPFGSGMFFLLIFAFLLNVFLYYYSRLPISFLRKTVITAGIGMPVFGIFASGSQTAFLGFIIALLASFLLYIAKSNLPLSLPFFLVIFVVIGFTFVMIILAPYLIQRQISFEKIAFELDPSQDMPPSRAYIWRGEIVRPFQDPLRVLIGLGKSSVTEAHNHYIRNFVETGILGFLLFLLLLFAILKRSFHAFFKGNNPFLLGVSAGLIVTTLVMLMAAMTAEAFLAVKISEVYWFFTGITMTVLFLHKKKLSYGTNKT